MTRFFHDVVPWWHLISPAFVIFVVLPLLYWSTTKRGDWSGWNGLAQSYGVDAWPGDASDLGAPRYCRVRRRDGCAPQKFDQQLRVAARAHTAGQSALADRGVMARGFESPLWRTLQYDA